MNKTQKKKKKNVSGSGDVGLEGKNRKKIQNYL